MGQRISRAKASIKQSGLGFAMPPADELPGQARPPSCTSCTSSSTRATPRVPAPTSSGRTSRPRRSGWPGSWSSLVPDEGEAAGLLALMLLTDARRPARPTADGSIVPLADQDRSLWDAAEIAEGVALITRTLGAGPIGPYQLQAAIAAIHDEAPTAADTDWHEILALYEVLEQVSPGPVVTLNRAVAVAMVDGPRAGLAVLGTLDDDARMAQNHRAGRGPRPPAGTGRRTGRGARRLGERRASRGACRNSATCCCGRPRSARADAARPPPEPVAEVRRAARSGGDPV